MTAGGGGGTAAGAGAGTAPDAGAGMTPAGGAGTATDAGAGITLGAGAGTAPDAGAGTAPDAGAGTAPDAGAGITPDAGAGITPGADGDRRTTMPERRSTRARDRGQVAVEYLGFLPILLLVALAGIQLGIAAYAAQQAGTGARAAARAATHDETTLGYDQAGRAAMSDWIADRATISPQSGTGEFTATVTVQIPSVVPFWDGFGSVTKSATLPLPEEGE
ncbi:TadE family protein [Streptomyces sp. NPDC090127]|uniref:TadE family protein n=1 Tax=Streptomyces sp. NPDC090127 TaxID=3365953 RepID=UPI003816B076